MYVLKTMRFLCMKRISQFSLSSAIMPTSRQLIKKGLGVGMVLALSLLSLSQAQAHNRHKPKPLYIMGQESAVVVTVGEYELALVQVLSEICPPMLNKEEREQFESAYQNQLRVFIPKVENPSEILRRLGGQQEYRSALQSMRTWTANYSDGENRALCQELAQKTHPF